MKPLIVLRRFLHQLPKEAKKSINQDQNSCASEGQFQPIASGCLFFQHKAQPVAVERQWSTATGEMAEPYVHLQSK